MSTASLVANPCLRDAAAEFKREGERKVTTTVPCHLQLQREALGPAVLPLSGVKARGTALLHPEAPRERDEKPWGAATPNVLRSPVCHLGPAAFCDIPGFRWEIRGHPSSLHPPAPPWVIWLLGVQDLAGDLLPTVLAEAVVILSMR